MNTSHVTLVSNLDGNQKVAKFSGGRLLAIFSSILLAGPVLGWIFTIVSMIRIFSGTGIASDSSKLTSLINMVLVTASYGLVAGLVGVVLVKVVLAYKLNREKWFYKSVSFLSVCWCICLFPLGMIVGIYLYRSFSSRRHEFYTSVKSVKSHE